MNTKILLDDNSLQLTEDYLPLLISYAEKSGGTQFSLNVISDLFLSGSKIIFLTAYPMATDDFLESTKHSEYGITRLTSVSDIEGNENVQAIMIDSGNEKLFLETVNSLQDIDSRILFVKNFELYSGDLIKKCISFEKIILSGNIDRCELKDEVLKKEYSTTVLFSQPEAEIQLKVPNLEKYSGYMWSKDSEGVVKITS